MGDQKALETFVTKYYPAILKYCRLHIDDYGYAEDMARRLLPVFSELLSNTGTMLYLAAKRLGRQKQKGMLYCPYLFENLRRAVRHSDGYILC